MIELRTARLVVRSVEPDDLDPLLAVMLSNPEKRLLDEGSAGEAGRYDRGMLERDLWLGGLQPGGHDAVLVEDGAVIGMLAWMDASPTDGWPWLGTVEVAASRQRQGFADEACRCVFELVAGQGPAGMRAGVPAPLAGARAFAESLGMREVARVERKLAAGPTDVAVMQIDFPARGVPVGPLEFPA